MTTLSPSPAIVALVQAATTLPFFLFALLAGALADRVDKRRFLIVVNVGLAVVVTALAALTALGWMTSSGLLAFTFVIGTGAAFMAPAWQAIVPSLVPREILQPAIAPNSMGINISRAIGDRQSEEHTSELQSLMRISYAVFCLNKKKTTK